MVRCVFKSCKNSHKKNNLSNGTSYFRFPCDPFRYAEWVSIVANERNEENYKATNYSVICSLHFDEKDVIRNHERRRLRNFAVPKVQIQPQLKLSMSEQTESSLENDRLNNSDTKSIQSVSPPYKCDISIEVKVEPWDEDENQSGCSATNPFSDTTSGPWYPDTNTIENNGSAVNTITNPSEQENDSINVLEVNEKFPGKLQGNNTEKVFYIRKVIPQDVRKEKNRTIVKQYTLTIGTIMKGIEEQSKENVEECDKYLDIFCRNMHGQFRNITLSFYDEEVNKSMKFWGNWYNMFPLSRSTPLMYKCYICHKGWWRLYPFKDHLKEHRNVKFYLRAEVIEHEFNVVTCTKTVLRMENVEMDSNCWRCGRDAAFHVQSTSTLKYVCSGCNESLVTCTQLIEHESACLENIKLTREKYNVDAGEGKRCTVCNMYCVNEHILDAHMIDYHLVRSDEPVVVNARPCTHCGCRYVYSKLHDCPAKSRLYECHYCYKSFTSTLFRKIHLKLSKYYLKSNASGTCMTQLALSHYLRHSNNYRLFYESRKCDSDVLFTSRALCVTHLQSHNKKAGIGRILLPTKCFNGDIVDCETILSVPDKRLAKFMTGLESLPKEALTHTTPNMTNDLDDDVTLISPNMTSDVDDDGIILDDKDDELPMESAENSENIVEKDYEIDATQTQLEEEIMRDLEMETDICKVLQSSKSYQLLMEEESLEKTSEENNLVNEMSKTKDITEQELLKKKSNEITIMNEESKTKDIIEQELLKKKSKEITIINEESKTNDIIEQELLKKKSNEITIMNEESKTKDIIEQELLKKKSKEITIINEESKTNDIIEQELFKKKSNENTIINAETQTKDIMEQELLKKKSNKITIMIKESKTTDIMEKESIKKEVSEIESTTKELTKESTTEKYIKTELIEAEENDICEDNFIFIDDGVEDISAISDVESEITLENSPEMNTEIKQQYQRDQIQRVLKHYNNTYLRPDDLIENYSPVNIKEENVTNGNSLKISREKVKIEPSDIEEAYIDTAQIIVNNPSIYMDVDVQVDQLYDCKNCDYSGIWNQYTVHVSTECPKTEFSCNLCAHFQTLIDYLKHLTVHGYKPLSCPECLERTGSIDELQSHVASHILGLYSDGKSSSSKETSLYYCLKCGNCVQLECFFKHWQMHVNGLCYVEDDYTAESGIDDEEGVVVMSQELISEILRLLRKKNRTLMKQCIVCLKVVMRGNELKRHLIQHLLAHAMYVSKRKMSTIIRCYFCKKKYRKIDEWKSHMRRHSCLHVYECPLCTKCFNDSSNFSKHKKVHNLFSYICDICGGKFSKRKSLIQHLKLHEHSLTCAICDQTFISESRLKKHTLHKHNGHPEKGRQFFCPVCTKRLKCYRDREEHLWMQHGIRKMMADCPICGEAFRLQAMVKRHMMSKHNAKYKKIVARNDKKEE